MYQALLKSARTVKALAGIFLLTAALSGCRNSQETVTGENDTYKEKHRLQYHFSPPEMWMNDPNGMVFYEGEYHLFYQHYPDSNVWGPMHWGHAVSEDMVHWENLPIALQPDSLGYIYSGSAVVDHNNTSGLGTSGQPPLVAIFTYHDPVGEQAGRNDFQTQGIAYSLDKGRTWTTYENNPVLGNPGIRDFRDPKVIWHEGSGRWIMVLAVADHVSFYSSRDLINWQFESDFGKDIGGHGGVWECPDLFELEIEGSGRKAWVLLVSINPGGPNGGSATQYFVGDFDGQAFTLDEMFARELDSVEAIWLDYGSDNYAGVTWSDVPEEDGRRIFIGWMSNWNYANVVPTYAWRSAMTVPRTLELVSLDSTLRVRSWPVDELGKLGNGSISLEPEVVSRNISLSKKYGVDTSLVDIEIELDLSASTDAGLKFSNTQGEYILVGYSVENKELYIDRTNSGKTEFSDNFAGRHTAPLEVPNAMLRLRILLDVASVEVFAGQGLVTMTDIFFPNENYRNIDLYIEGNVKIVEGSISTLQSIW